MKIKLYSAIIIASFLFPTLSFGARKHAIKVATVAPKGTTWVNELEKTNQKLKKASQGKLRFRIYAGGILGDESDVVRKIRVGQVQAAVFTGMGLGEILPEVRVLEVPFLAKSDDDVNQLVSGLMGRFQKGFEKKGFVLLGFVPVGFVYIFSDKPVRSLADLRKSKMWVWEGDPLARSLFQTGGVSGIPLALPDVLTSLQTGLINAVYGTPLGVIALQWHTKVKWRSDLAIAHVMGGFIVSKKKFDKLPAEYQKLLKTETAKLSQELTTLGRKENQEALQTLDASGIQVSKIETKEKENFLMLGKKVAQSEKGKLYPAALLQQAQKLASGSATK